MLEQIIASDSPKDAKALGRMVKDFDASEWGSKFFDIVVNGNVHKFSQNPAMREFLLSTTDTIIVEAAPRDQIWVLVSGSTMSTREILLIGLERSEHAWV